MLDLYGLFYCHCMRLLLACFVKRVLPLWVWLYLHRLVHVCWACVCLIAGRGLGSFWAPDPSGLRIQSNDFREHWTFVVTTNILTWSDLLAKAFRSLCVSLSNPGQYLCSGNLYLFPLATSCWANYLYTYKKLGESHAWTPVSFTTRCYPQLQQQHSYVSRSPPRHVCLASWQILLIFKVMLESGLWPMLILQLW